MNGYIFGYFGCSDWKGGGEDVFDLFGCSLVHIHIQQVSFMGFFWVSQMKYANSDVCRFFSCSTTDTRTGIGRRYVFVL